MNRPGKNTMKLINIMSFMKTGNIRCKNTLVNNKQ
jgi:hypothetical protein